jgi:gamma-glutamyltranspeptidase
MTMKPHDHHGHPPCRGGRALPRRACGFEILEAGGNAIDAGVAAGLAIGVLQTEKVNFGGVAPQIIYTAKNRKVHCIDGLGVWPGR